MQPLMTVRSLYACNHSIIVTILGTMSLDDDWPLFFSFSYDDWPLLLLWYASFSWCVRVRVSESQILVKSYSLLLIICWNLVRKLAFRNKEWIDNMLVRLMHSAYCCSLLKVVLKERFLSVMAWEGKWISESLSMWVYVVWSVEA